MLDAVLFDWGDTLFHFAWDEELIEAGWRAGIAALGRDDLPGHDVAAARFREEYLPVLWLPDALDEIEYPGMVREVFEHLGASVSDDDVARFLEAEHAAWAPARRVGDASHALLDALRERGLKTALVSNAFDPPWLLHRDLEDMGFSERLDAAVFSSEVGKRKPHPAIFEEALARLDVDPERALFVGDRRVPDIQGARAVGMSTVLAYWFRADPEEDGIEPDYEAFTQMDVLNIVRRLTGET